MLTLTPIPSSLTAIRESELVDRCDRSKNSGKLTLQITAFLLGHPHARLLRDTVGHAKYTICEMGSSKVYGEGTTAHGAWDNAFQRQTNLVIQTTPPITRTIRASRTIKQS